MNKSGGPAKDRRHEIPTADKSVSRCRDYTGRRESTEFADIYRRGFDAGVEVGRGQVEYEQTRAYLQDIEDQPELAATRGPSLSELKRIRAELPEDRDNCRCRVRCARCDWVDRRGGDHPGGPVVWSVAS